MDALYSGAAELGRIQSLVGAIGASVVGVILLIIGVMILRKKDNKTAKVGGLLRNIMCYEDTVNGNEESVTTCTGEYVYTVNGKKYVKSYSGNSGFDGQEVIVRYDPKNPADSTINNSLPNWSGWIFIGFAVIMVGGSWLWYWATMESKTFAAVTGGMDAVDDFRDML
jgi:uncharacterized membrane protein